MPVINQVNKPTNRPPKSSNGGGFFKKMNKVSELIKEVKPHYKKDKNLAVKVACIFFALLVGGTTLEVADMHYNIVDTVKYGQQFTAEDLGFQTDEYGLLMVDGDEL